MFNLRNYFIICRVFESSPFDVLNSSCRRRKFKHYFCIGLHFLKIHVNVES